MLHRAFFDTTAEAVQHARQFGGWIAECTDGTVQWFDATKWTWSPICRAIGEGTIGVWPLFDPDHECHKILKR